MSLADDYIGSERILEVSSRSHIRFEANRFVIEARESDRSAAVPAGDVLALVLETEQATITTATLAACAESGIPVICCRRHLPASLCLPKSGDCRSAGGCRLLARTVPGFPAFRWRRPKERGTQLGLCGAVGDSGSGACSPRPRPVPGVRPSRANQCLGAGLRSDGAVPTDRGRRGGCAIARAGGGGPRCGQDCDPASLRK